MNNIWDKNGCKTENKNNTNWTYFHPLQPLHQLQPFAQCWCMNDRYELMSQWMDVYMWYAEIMKHVLLIYSGRKYIVGLLCRMIHSGLQLQKMSEMWNKENKWYVFGLYYAVRNVLFWQEFRVLEKCYTSFCMWKVRSLRISKNNIISKWELIKKRWKWIT